MIDNDLNYNEKKNLRVNCQLQLYLSLRTSCSKLYFKHVQCNGQKVVFKGLS